MAVAEGLPSNRAHFCQLWTWLAPSRPAVKQERWNKRRGPIKNESWDRLENAQAREGWGRNEAIGPALCITS
ncbi:hypothetical protein NDU88_008562 [Pleurodeles waltl]|uniref:Uncharacterized protein n=1 Tax=Pleurodeles waltl TaxID=8319 RepID=A0AAV7N5C7_PLEWA|nr:hypothetical protein NDU88_008562 [Pleurodeles waltl]